MATPALINRRALGFLLALMCCVGSAASHERIDQTLARMKEQLYELEELLKAKRIEFDSERKFISEIDAGNMERLEKLRVKSAACPDKFKVFESYFVNSSQDGQRKLAFWDKWIKNQMEEVENLRAVIQYSEIISQMQPDGQAFPM